MPMNERALHAAAQLHLLMTATWLQKRYGRQAGICNQTDADANRHMHDNVPLLCAEGLWQQISAYISRWGHVNVASNAAALKTCGTHVVDENVDIAMTAWHLQCWHWKFSTPGIAGSQL